MWSFSGLGAGSQTSRAHPGHAPPQVRQNFPWPFQPLLLQAALVSENRDKILLPSKESRLGIRKARNTCHRTLYRKTSANTWPVLRVMQRKAALQSQLQRWKERQAGVKSQVSHSRSNWVGLLPRPPPSCRLWSHAPDLRDESNENVSVRCAEGTQQGPFQKVCS